jgi:hypothetical protein
MRTGGFELGSSALMSSTLKWLHRIQCGFKLSLRAWMNLAEKFVYSQECRQICDIPANINHSANKLAVCATAV